MVLYIFLKGALKMQEMLFQNFPLVQVPRSPSLPHFKTSTLEYLNLQYAMKKSAEGILHSSLHTHKKSNNLKVICKDQLTFPKFTASDKFTSILLSS